MTNVFLAIAAVLACLAIQVLGEFLSQSGVLSVLHGGMLGYLQVHVAKWLLEWGGVSMGWLIVIPIMAAVMSVSIYRVRYACTRSDRAFNIGILGGILLGGCSLI
jgi:hypothetical protein